ncbi:MAG: hypothetical protein IPP35_01650 [Elusimicrobia bacterium]|nr:hypothetical protein [Elusimicrobiota bacterium]
MKLKLFTGVAIVLAWSGGAVPWAWAESDPARAVPWETFSVTLGGMLSKTDSVFRVGSGLGVDVDFEKTLGLETKTTVFRAESGWRFTENRRHRLDASWFALHRDGSRTLGFQFDVEKPDGSITTISTGTEISSHLDVDIYELAYSYSFVQDDRLDLAVVGGLYVMPVDFGFSASGVTVAEGGLTFSAPLPVIGYRMDFAMTPKWFFRSGTQIFYVDYNGFVGSLSDIRAAFEYQATKNLGLGLGFDNFRVNFEGNGSGLPGSDLDGTIAFENRGLQFYAKYIF